MEYLNLIKETEVKVVGNLTKIFNFNPIQRYPRNRKLSLRVQEQWLILLLIILSIMGGMMYLFWNKTGICTFTSNETINEC